MAYTVVVLRIRSIVLTIEEPLPMIPLILINVSASLFPPRSIPLDSCFHRSRYDYYDYSRLPSLVENSSRILTSRIRSRKDILCIWNNVYTYILIYNYLFHFFFIYLLFLNIRCQIGSSQAISLCTLEREYKKWCIDDNDLCENIWK